MSGHSTDISGHSTAAQSAAPSVTIDEIALADDPSRWQALGFAVQDGTVALGTIRLRLAGREAGRGILGWSLRGIAATSELDGLPTTAVTAPRDGAGATPARAASLAPVKTPAPAHPNGESAIDHVVAFSPQLDRSVRSLKDAGLDLRRVREQPTPAGAPRQAFFRLGEAILELVQIPESELGRAGGEDAPARFWGLALLSDEIERTAHALGEHVSEVRPAIQPGRRIATLKRTAGLAVPVALMSPTPS
jgi:hypothetical protein